MLPPTVPLKFSISRAVPYSVIEVPRMGMLSAAPGYEAVDDGRAYRGIAGGVLDIDDGVVSQTGLHSFLEALGRGVESGMLYELAYSDVEYLRFGLRGGLGGLRFLLFSAGREAEDEQCRYQQ